MAPSIMLIRLACIISLSCAVLAQDSAEKLPTFGDTVQIFGEMERTDQDFQDGLALDLFSPTNRTVVVNQNTKPLAGQFVSGTTGGPFVALSNYSYMIKLNETANDLIAKIEIPYDPVALQQQGVSPANTYVGQLASDGKSWVIDESRRNVHMTENNTRIIKMTSLEGEFMLLGRQSVDTSNIFVQYGFGATRTVNLTGGSGVQQAEFVDGLGFSMQVDSAMRMNVDIPNGVRQEELPTAMPPLVSLNSFAWVINSTADGTPTGKANVTFPINQAMISSKVKSQSFMLKIAHKPTGANQFQALSTSSTLQANMLSDGSGIAVTGLEGTLTDMIDGSWVVLVGDTTAN